VGNASAPRTSPEGSPSMPEPRTVPGMVVTVAAPSALLQDDPAGLPHQTLPAAPDPSGGTQ
jgi:hypothetical protein